MLTEVLRVPVLGVCLQGTRDEFLAAGVGVAVFDGGGADSREHGWGFGGVEDACYGGGGGCEEAGGGEEGEVFFAHGEDIVAGEEVLDPEVAVGSETVAELLDGRGEEGGGEGGKV